MRFGAYHIYVPALLKPAARALASLLWALKQDNVDMSALSGAQHLAGSGRTSFPVDKPLDRDAYRVLGYRQCGERAVRVDILERLADLIRPALAWREASPGEKPAGAFDGRGFVVTQAMTSLTGSAGEDFASILRALGYRMEKPPGAAAETGGGRACAGQTEVAAQSETTPSLRRRVPDARASMTDGAATEPAPETLSEAAAVEASAATGNLVADSAEAFAPDAQHAIEETPAPSATLLPEVAFSVTDSVTDAGERAEPKQIRKRRSRPKPRLPKLTPEQSAAESTLAASESTEAASAETETATPDAAAAPDATTSEAIAAPDAAAVPEMVEVWRPGGRSEERRPRHDRNRRRPSPSATGAAPAAAAGEATRPTRPSGTGRGRRDRHNEFRKRVAMRRPRA